MSRITRFGEINKEKRNIIIGILVLMLAIWFFNTRSSFEANTPNIIQLYDANGKILMGTKSVNIPNTGTLVINYAGVPQSMVYYTVGSKNIFLPNTYLTHNSGNVNLNVNAGDTFTFHSKGSFKPTEFRVTLAPYAQPIVSTPSSSFGNPVPPHVVPPVVTPVSTPPPIHIPEIPTSYFNGIQLLQHNQNLNNSQFIQLQLSVAYLLFYYIYNCTATNSALYVLIFQASEAASKLAVLANSNSVDNNSANQYFTTILNIAKSISLPS